MDNNRIFMSFSSALSYVRDDSQHLYVDSKYSEPSSYTIIPFLSTDEEQSKDVSPISFLSSLVLPALNISDFSNDTGLLPPGVKSIGKNYVVYERPPAVKNIFYIPSRVDEIESVSNPYIFSVPIPWQIYIAFFTDDYYCSDVYMYFSNTQLQSLDHPISMPALPNFYINGHLCRPKFASFEDIDMYTKDISGVVASSYDWVWNNGTNNDLTEPLVHLLLQNLEGSIRRNASDGVMAKYFTQHRLSSISYLSPTEVLPIMLSWEKMTIDDALEYHWPNPIFDFTSINNLYQTLPGTDVWEENLVDFVMEYCADPDTGDPPSEDEIESIICNEDYPGREYVDWLVNRGYVNRPDDPFKNSVTYSDALKHAIANSKIPTANFCNLESDINKAFYTFFQS